MSFIYTIYNYFVVSLIFIDFFGLPTTCIRRGRDNTEVQHFLDNSWYKTNVGGTGFYRVDYEKGNWKKLHGVFEKNHEVFNFIILRGILNFYYKFYLFLNLSCKDIEIKT